jgi:heme/copper-type cytochrome/quinol oxidase subunit 1
MSYVILGVLFFVVFGAVALAMRLLRRDPLQRAYDPKAQSYWSEARRGRTNESYFRQF